jgi:N-glycosylase/DNA lyase
MIIVVLKPLYRVAKAGTYWWAIYSKYYREKLLMTTSIYNLYLLVTTTRETFGIMGIQTNDTIILGNK